MSRIALVTALMLGACTESKDDTAARLEHPAAGVSDSALARSNLLGAGAVQKALDAQDSARARRALEDTIP